MTPKHRLARELWAEVLETSQALKRINIGGENYYRLAADSLCEACACDTGMLHAFMCVREPCPRCRALVMTCSCRVDRDDA